MPTKPRTYAEMLFLRDKGDIEILMVEFHGPPGDADIILLISDHRRTYEEGEIYEVCYPNPPGVD